MHDHVIRPFFFCWKHYHCRHLPGHVAIVCLTRLMVLNKKVKFCCNKTVLKPTSVVKYEMPSKLNFLICRVEEVENHCGPQIFEASHLSLFSVWIYEIFIYTVPRFISSARRLYCKCRGSHSDNASKNMARNLVLSRCFHGYKFCRMNKSFYKLINTFQQILSKYLSFHKSYCVFKLSPPFWMTLYKNRV